MKNAVAFSFLILLLCLTASDVSAQAEKRIKFKRGAISADATGKLSGYDDKKAFVIKVNEGQTLSTEQIRAESSSRYITILITDPNGELVGDSDASCNNRREIAPTVAGDYRIEVVECQKADPWRGKFKFRVTVR
ncbi:MAG: hypothetical protein KF685_02110 [Acidobacteria bacterium]|nr:hypothetical protein [Acidobacteriota bacterium]